ncbi:hypothetical protein EMIT0P228_150138 [Pseudomonas brassicacearum]
MTAPGPSSLRMWYPCGEGACSRWAEAAPKVCERCALEREQAPSPQERLTVSKNMNPEAYRQIGDTQYWQGAETESTCDAPFRD